MEEIEELRAKAIASMPFSTNPNASSTAAGSSGGGGFGRGKFKSPKSREEGEVTSGEDAELATCSVGPINSENLGESVPNALKKNAKNAVKNALTPWSSTPGIQLRPSVMQTYQKHHHKHFKRKLPFRSRTGQAHSWHAKDSNNNLVIRFSDDDSGSESEEPCPEKDVIRMDGASNAHDSRLAVNLLPKPTEGVEREPDGSKLILKKGFANHEIISSADGAYEATCAPRRTSAENGSHLNQRNPAIKTSESREVGLLQDATMADQRLDLLRHQIAARENELKVQNRSLTQKEVTVGSDSQATGTGRHAYDTNLEFEVNESSRKRLKHDKSSSEINCGAPSKPENVRTFHVDNSCTQYQPDDANTVKSSVIKPKDSILALSTANLHDEALSENVDVAKNLISEKFSKKAGVSNLPSNYVGSMDIIMRSLNEENATEEGSMSFDSLVKLEELHDKELEEAQEYRSTCELEERNALKAYRKAQRSLIEANERCTFLYAKREHFSAKFRAFVMKASNSICPSDWLYQRIPLEDQFYEPNASKSDHRDDSLLDGAALPTRNPNMSMDDDGVDFLSNNRVVESRSDHVDVQNEKTPFLDNSQDYELLEASLRSELVARLGLRASSKTSDTSKRELDVEKRTGSVAADMERSPSPHNMMPVSDAKQTAKLDGIEKTKGSSCLPGAPVDSKLPLAIASSNEELHSVDSKLPGAPIDSKLPLAIASSNEELHSVADLDTNNSFPKNSGSPTKSAFLSLPSSGLHLVCRHIYMIFPGFHTDTCNMKENDHFVTSKEVRVSDFIPDNVGEFLNLNRPAPMGFRRISLKIDPFWPLCMFEFRGKCNDEECPWQHMKAGMFPKMLDDEHSNFHATCLLNGYGKLDAPRFSCSALLHVLPIPTYQIGPYLIKADSHQSQSVLARSNWQYRQRGFCASFLIPFSVERILPLDAPCLQTGDDSGADDYSWNKLPLYFRSQDDTLSFKEQDKQGSADVEQLIELALDEFDGELCESGRRKALSQLSNAIKSYPSSVVLWVVFLHIYYKKEKAIEKDDYFLYAVRCIKSSYILWLLYINSRIVCEDRLNAFDRALNVLHLVGGRVGRQHSSSYILDIFLQMIDFLSMSGHVDKAISRICGLLPSNEFDECGGNPLRDICTSLTVPDRCLFWISSIYFVVYEKLPETTVKQFEFAKNLPFGLDWPSAQLTSDRTSLSLDLFQLAMTEMASYFDENPKKFDQSYLQSLHLLAANHLKCSSALLGFPRSTELLHKYLKAYPSCIELFLIAIRSKQNYSTDLDYYLAFEEVLRLWPKETTGIQCIWNQFVEHSLTNNQIGLAEKLMARWYHDFPKYRDPINFCSTTLENSNSRDLSKTKDDAFGFLNFFLYSMLQKNTADARSAIDKSLELAAPEDYHHFLKEQALFITSNDTESPIRNSSSLLNRYLADPRANLLPEPLSRRFIRTMKNPRIRQMVSNLLGPISRTSTLLNSVLKVCYGPSLLPENFTDIKETVNFVEFLMEINPANYELGLSLYRICRQKIDSVKFWACSLLINSIFQAAPAAPEHIWLDAADVLKTSENLEINLRFHKQAVSVYPFSLKLWQSYANLHGDASEIVKAARERGIELNSILNRGMVKD